MASASHPVLDSVLSVVRGSRDVATDLDRIREVAGWMAYEELPMPQQLLAVPPGLTREEIVDFVLVATSLNYAYTDFETRVRWEVEVDGRPLADADGLHWCLARALAEGVPLLDGAWLSTVTTEQLRDLLRGGNGELQLLDERAAILREIGAALVEKYDGRFSNVLAAASPKLYDGGNGFLEVLTRDFPRFDDVAEYDGQTVRFYKLAQLAVWILHVTLRPHGGLRLDIENLTAFADYIVPAALRILGVFRYDDSLEATIAEGGLIGAGSRWEVELRAHTIYACDELCRAVNALRPPELRVIPAQIDARLWVPYHRTHYPHHLTKTIYY